MRYVKAYAGYKSSKKNTGSLDIQKIPGVNHPVFKDKPVNHDPREVFIAKLFAERGEYNVFHEFYRTLVQALFDAGVSRTVYCVNIDAVIAALLLKMLWKPYQSGQYSADGPRDSSIHDLPVPTHAGLRRGNRRPPEPRPEHGHAYARIAMPVRGLRAPSHLRRLPTNILSLCISVKGMPPMPSPDSLRTAKGIQSTRNAVWSLIITAVASSLA